MLHYPLLNEADATQLLVDHMMMMMSSFTAYSGHFSVHRGTLDLFSPLYIFSDALSSELSFVTKVLSRLR